MNTMFGGSKLYFYQFSCIKEFILECKKYIQKVEVTVVTYPGIDIQACKKVSEELNVPLRIRQYGLVG